MPQAEELLNSGAVLRSKIASIGATHDLAQQECQSRRIPLSHTDDCAPALIYIPSTLFVAGNSSATANNIAAHETLFRLGILSDLFTATMDIFPLWPSTGSSRRWTKAWLG
jgi:hypothetical protein